MKSNLMRAGVFGACMSLMAAAGYGANGTWTGATSTWQSDTNWNGATYPGTSATDFAAFITSGNTTPTIGSGTLTLSGLRYTNGNTNFTITGAGVDSTTLLIDPNNGSAANFINFAGNGSSTSTTQTFSNLTLVLRDTLTGGQSKLLMSGSSKAIVLDSSTRLTLGAGQTFYVENGTAGATGTLDVNGILNSLGAGALLLADERGVINLNYAAGSDLSNINLQAGNGATGTINLFVGGNQGGNLVTIKGDGGRVNVAASGLNVSANISANSTVGLNNGVAGVIGTTYSSGTSTWSGNVTMSDPSLGNPKTQTFDVATGGTLVMSGSLGGGDVSLLTVAKTGGGTLELTNAQGNAYNSTAFNVTAGNLRVNNASNSAIGSAALNVSSGAMISGTGRITGATTISGIVAPGNSIGTLSIANDVTWNGGAVAGSVTDWQFELGSGNTADLLNITGGSSDFLKGTGSVYRFDFMGSLATGSFVLINWEGTTNFNIGDFSYTNLGASNTGSFQFNGSQLEFVAVIPEPQTWGLLTAGIMAALIFRRKRR